MPRAYFVDAWFYIALLHPRDTHHGNVLRLTKRVAGASLLTHEGVFTEVLAYFAEEGSQARRLAAEMVRKAALSTEIVSVDRTLFSRALDLYERRPDKEYSLVDCMSMELMRARSVTHVRTNDHHFRQEGFSVLSDAP